MIEFCHQSHGNKYCPPQSEREMNMIHCLRQFRKLLVFDLLFWFHVTFERTYDSLLLL